jgi:hypothetical protein
MHQPIRHCAGGSMGRCMVTGCAQELACLHCRCTWKLPPARSVHCSNTTLHPIDSPHHAHASSLHSIRAGRTCNFAFLNALLCSSHLLASLLCVCSLCVCVLSCVLGIPAVHRALVRLFPACMPPAPSISHLPSSAFTCLRCTLLLSIAIAGDSGDSGAETFHSVCIHGARPLGAAAALFAGTSPRECYLPRPLHFSAAPSVDAIFHSPPCPQTCCVHSKNWRLLCRSIWTFSESGESEILIA